MNDWTKLVRYLDGNLSAQESQSLEKQLIENAELREELALLKRIQATIAKRPPEPSPGLWVGIETRLSEEGLINPLWDQLVWAGKRLVPLMVAAAIILMAVNLSTETGVTIDDYFDSQTELLLSEIDANTSISIPETTE